MSTVTLPSPDGGGDLALQPHRRARPRRRSPRPDRGRPSTGWSPADDRRAAAPRPPVDVFAELNAAHAEVVRAAHPRRARTWPTRSRWCGARPADGTAVFPRLVVEAGAGSEVTVVERFASDDVRALVVPVTELHAGDGAHLRYVGREPARAPRLADRPPGGPRRARLHVAPRHRGPRRRLRPGAHRRPPRRHRRHRRPDRRLLRRGRPDARLPHPAGPRRAQDDVEPAVQGGRRRTTPAASTPASSACGRRRRAPTPSRPTATSSCPRGRGPTACPTSRSRTTTCAAATPRPSARSTTSSASTSRAGACRRRRPSA